MWNRTSVEGCSKDLVLQLYKYLPEMLLIVANKIIERSGHILRGTDPCLLRPGWVLITRVLFCARLAPILWLAPCSPASSCISNFSIFFLVFADGLVMRWLAKNSDMMDIIVPHNTMPMIWIIVNPVKEHRYTHTIYNINTCRCVK